MRFAFISIAIYALISFTYGNKAADDTKKESVKQGKSIIYSIVYFFKWPLYLTLINKDRNETKSKCFRCSLEAHPHTTKVNVSYQ